ncbi:hypothetical protein E5D57_010244 [Metarhizium anisopliae]|nr:hypothetical protein E5D57_010244 [Metarhizium anisopliae]
MSYGIDTLPGVMNWSEICMFVVIVLQKATSAPSLINLKHFNVWFVAELLQHNGLNKPHRGSDGYKVGLVTGQGYAVCEFGV